MCPPPSILINEKESNIFIAYITFNIANGGLATIYRTHKIIA